MGKYLDLIRQHEGTQPIEMVKAEELKQQKAFGQIPSVRPGERITWGADGTLRGPALVEFLHTDADGITWAFVTRSTGMVAVNTKYILKHEDAGHD